MNGENPGENPEEEIISISKSGRIRPENNGGALCRALETQEKMLVEFREILADLEIALRPALRPKENPPPEVSKVQEITTSDLTRMVEQNNQTIQAAALDAAGLLDHLDI